MRIREEGAYYDMTLGTTDSSMSANSSITSKGGWVGIRKDLLLSQA